MPRRHLRAFWMCSDPRRTHGANFEVSRNEKPGKMPNLNFWTFNGRKGALRAPLRPAHVKSVFWTDAKASVERLCARWMTEINKKPPIFSFYTLWSRPPFPLFAPLALLAHFSPV